MKLWFIVKEEEDAADATGSS